MKNILYRFILFCGLSLLATMLIGWIIEKIHYQDVAKFEDRIYPQSNLFYLEKNKTYDRLVMGSSRGLSVKSPIIPGLGAETLNLGIPGGGVRLQQAYLQHFYNQGCQAKQLLYFIDPFAIHTDKWDYTWYLLRHEPFRLDFAWQLLKKTNLKMLGIYMASKVQVKGFSYFHIYNNTEVGVSLTERDTAAIPNVIKGLYGAETKGCYERQTAILSETIKLAKEHQTKIIFCIAPTLLGDEPYQARLTAFLVQQKQENEVIYYDFHNLLNQPKYYHHFRDYSHLNNKGMVYFYDNFLEEKLKN